MYSGGGGIMSLKGAMWSLLRGTCLAMSVKIYKAKRAALSSDMYEILCAHTYISCVNAGFMSVQGLLRALKCGINTPQVVTGIGRQRSEFPFCDVDTVSD